MRQEPSGKKKEKQKRFADVDDGYFKVAMSLLIKLGSHSE
jgi:hypothetical protein